jgi:Uma2 family endonuclease
MSELVTFVPADRQRFSLHEEEDVVEVPPHRRQIVYFETNLQVELPDRFVVANMGVYWVPGQYENPWTGPDLFVAARPAKAPPRVWLVWEDGPLQFVAEVASERTRRGERRKREGIYRDALRVPEALYVDLDRRQLELWRLREGAYRRVREEGGRLFSQEMGVWFGWDAAESFVRIWSGDGRMLSTPEEKEQQLQEAEVQAQEERRLRQEEQRLRQEEQRLRQEAEQRASEEARARQEAELRTAEEARARREAEARAEALAVEL